MPETRTSVADKNREDRDDKMALLCCIYACDRAGREQTIDLPLPGTQECNALFLATWAAFRPHGGQLVTVAESM